MVRETISWLKTRIQEDLFPHLKKCFTDPLTKKQKQLITILELVQIESFVKSHLYQWMGRKLKDRQAIARAFVAKTIYNFPTTKLLIEALKTMSNLRMICGFNKKSEIPSESTFSRAFAEFAESELGDRVQKALVEEHLSEQLIGHISRDATAIEGNEKPAEKGKKAEAKEESKKRGRPKKGEIREDKKEDKRLNIQVNQTPSEAL